MKTADCPFLRTHGGVNDVSLHGSIMPVILKVPPNAIKVTLTTPWLTVALPARTGRMALLGRLLPLVNSG